MRKIDKKSMRIASSGIYSSGMKERTPVRWTKELDIVLIVCGFLIMIKRMESAVTQKTLVMDKKRKIKDLWNTYLSIFDNRCAQSCRKVTNLYVKIWHLTIFGRSKDFTLLSNQIHHVRLCIRGTNKISDNDPCKIQTRRSDTMSSRISIFGQRYVSY